MISTEINKENLAALSGLSDEELREKILSVVASCGIDRKTAEARLPDMKLIKKKLASISDRDIRTLTAALGEDKIGKIKDALGDGSK